MKTQTYANHRHNPKLTAFGFLFLVIGAVGFALRWFNIGGRYSMALGIFGLICSIQTLLSMSRLHITKLQDRIIRLEMQVRCMSALSPAQQVITNWVPDWDRT